MFNAELRRAMTPVKLLIGFAATLFLYFFSFNYTSWINIVKYPSNSMLYWMEVMHLEMVTARSLLPIAAALPYAASIALDINNRFYMQAINRSSYSRFAMSRYMAAGMTGGLILSLSRLALLVVLSYSVPIYILSDLEYVSTFHAWMINNNYPALFIISQVLFQFIFGFWAAGLSLCTATVTSQKGVIYTFTTLMIFAATQLFGFNIQDFSAGYSRISYTQTNPFAVPLIIISIGVTLSGVIYVIFHFSLKRRIKI